MYTVFIFLQNHSTWRIKVVSLGECFGELVVAVRRCHSDLRRRRPHHRGRCGSHSLKLALVSAPPGSQPLPVDGFGSVVTHPTVCCDLVGGPGQSDLMWGSARAPRNRNGDIVGQPDQLCISLACAYRNCDKIRLLIAGRTRDTLILMSRR